ncbi:MAG: M48 family metalloprotease [Candidatus Obscuribacterales bacterium]|nr:M48 family metalloprotease [Candidatus Obscuribacterales bacterium]
MAHRIIPHDDPKFPAIRRRLIITWLKTILGYLAMGGLCFAAFAGFGFSYKFQLGFGTLWMILPIVLWWFCDKIAIAMQRAVPADPSIPTHKKLIDIVDRVYAKSGLKFKPRVYVSPNPLPNAFATGPIHRKAVVAATEGLFNCGMTDREIEAVFAHELGHVKNYDVAINSFLTVLSSLFFYIVDQGVRAWVASIEWLRRLLGMKQETKILPAILGNVLMYVIFWATGQLTKIIQFFVVRSRESGADATGAMMTGDPCALASGLLKLVAYVEKNRPKGHQLELFRVMRPLMIVDPINDSLVAPPPATSLWGRLVRWWKSLQLTHPPVPDRVKELERMNGGACPPVV